METLNSILRFIESYCKDKKLYRIGIQMWGGEPLLAIDRIEYIVDFFKKTTITASMDVETNGSLVTDEVAKRLYDMNIQVGISIDGIPEFQNKQRPFINGKQTADIVKEGIRNLQKYYHDSIGGITVITKHNYKHIKEIIDYYIYTLKINSIKFNVVRDNPNAVAKNLALTPCEVFEFANELYDYLIAYKCVGERFTEGNIAARVRNLLYQSKDNLCISQGCQGGRKIISFSQDGGIFPCEMTDFEEVRIGSIFDNYNLDEMIDNAIQANKYFEPKIAQKCRTCPWWCYCKGGCTSRNRYLGISGKPDEYECAINRAIYPRIVEGILDGLIGG